MSTADLESFSINLTPENFYLETAHGLCIVKHFAPWCPHCKALAPHWAKLSVLYHKAINSATVRFGEINCDDQSQLCTDHGIQGYPTIYLYYRGEKVDEYIGKTNVIEGLDTYIKNITTFDWSNFGKSKKFDFEKITIEEKHQLSVPLFGKTFDIVDKWSFGFINFCDSTKESCKKIEPAWFELSNAMNAEMNLEGLNFAHIDCNTDPKICKDHDIKDFPTLKLFQKSKFVENYPISNGKDLESMKKFIVEKIEEQKKASKNKTPASEKPPTVELPPDFKKPTVDSIDKIAPDDADIESHSKFISRSSYLGKGNFTEMTKDGIWFIQFRSPTLGSHPFDSKWSHLSNHFSLFLSKYGIRFGILECGSEKEFCEKNEATSFPTIQTYELGSRIDTYTGTNSFDDLKKYIRDNTYKLRSASTTPMHIFSDALIPGIDGKTMPLTEFNFDKLTAQGPWFVFFKTTTCKSCRSIVPDWEDLASRYQKKVSFATVNCHNEKSLCEKLGVNVYPSFTFYKDGVSREYRGPYNFESLDKFANTASAPHLHILDSKALETVSKKESSYFLYIYNELDSLNSLASLEPIVKGIYLNTDLYVISSEKAKNLQVPSKLPAFQVYHNDKLFSEYTGPIDDAHKAKEWLTMKQFGPTVTLDIYNFDLVMNHYDSVVLAVVEPVKDQGSLNQYDELAKSYKTKSNEVGFGILDGILWKEYIERVYQHKHTELPFVVVTHPKSNVYDVNLPNGEPIPFSGDVLVKHVNGFVLKHGGKSISSQTSTESSPTTFFLIFFILGIMALFFRHRSKASKKTADV